MRCAISMQQVGANRATPGPGRRHGGDVPGLELVHRHRQVARPAAAEAARFSDSHEHLMEASRNTMLVPVDRARSVAELLAMVRDAARARREPGSRPRWG
jgi:hypothetical protein